MMVKMIEEWKEVLLKAWSVRWIVFANALGAAPSLVDNLDAYVDPHTMIKVMMVANFLALMSRFMKQSNMGDKPNAAAE
jgi:hypothetical protein